MPILADVIVSSRSGVDPHLEGTTDAPGAAGEKNEADELRKGFNHHGLNIPGSSATLHSIQSLESIRRSGLTHRRLGSSPGYRTTLTWTGSPTTGNRSRGVMRRGSTCTTSAS